jgi:hypothetical protein
MQATSVSEKQSWEICDEIGKLLVAKLDNKEIQDEVDQWIAEYVKTNNIDVDAKELADNLTWSVKVQLNAP